MNLIQIVHAKIKNPLLQRMAVYAFSDGVSKAIPFLIFPLVAAYLTTEEFGYVANFNVLSQILLAFVVINSHTYLTVDYYRLDDVEKNNLIRKILLFIAINSVVVAFFVFLLSPIIKDYLYIDLQWQLAAVLWAFGMGSTYIFQAFLRIKEKIKTFAKYQILQAIISTILTLILVVIFKFGLQGRLFSLLISVLSFGLLGYIYLLRYSRFSFLNLKLELKSIYQFGLPLLPHTISFWIKGGIDKIYITKFISLSATGIYAFAETFMLIFSMFSLAFFSAYTPHLYKKLSETTSVSSHFDILEIKLKIVKETAFFIICFILLLILGYAFIYFFILHFFYIKYGESLNYIHFLILSVFVSIIYSIFSSYLFYIKKTNILGFTNFSGSIVHTIINYFVIQTYGLKGMVITNLTMLSITTIIIVYLSEKHFPMPWKNLIHPIKTK